MMTSFLKVCLAQNFQNQLKLSNKTNILKCIQCLKQLQNSNTKSFSNFMLTRSNSSIEALVKKNSKLCGNRTIFTTPKNHAIPPVIWLLVKPFTKLSAVLFGR
jgi:hypothetical protein